MLGQEGQLRKPSAVVAVVVVVVVDAVVVTVVVVVVGFVLVNVAGFLSSYDPPYLYVCPSSS